MRIMKKRKKITLILSNTRNLDKVAIILQAVVCAHTTTYLS